jgi:hypothetical protein
MSIKMEIVPNSYDKRGNFPFCVGKITIHQKDDPQVFCETFVMALDYWTVEDYRQQWAEGLERIKTHDASCLVASAQNPATSPYILWWLLYRVEGEIFIYNHLVVWEDYTELIGNKPFTPSTCYDFIKPRLIKDDDGETYSEWVIDANTVGNFDEIQDPAIFRQIAEEHARQMKVKRKVKVKPSDLEEDVFEKGSVAIMADLGRRNGAYWKMFRKGTKKRIGMYNKDLTKRLGN